MKPPPSRFHVNRAGWWLAVLFLLPAGCDRAPAPPPPAAHAASAGTQPAGGKTLPRIDLAGFHRLIDQTAQDKQILVIDFWATWCDSCVELFPKLHERLAALGPRVRLVSVTLDAPGEYEAGAIDFLQTNHAMQDAYLLVPDADAQINIVKQLGKRWQDLVVPAILVYDTEGRLAGEYLDVTTHADTIAAGVAKLLPGSAATQP